MDVQRLSLLASIRQALSESPIVALLGARQVGKTTLARHIASGERGCRFFDLETQADRMALATPELALSSLHGLVVLDEIQRVPGLFEVLRPLADRPDNAARFLLLGSASPELVRGVSESLAGRVRLVHVPGFTLDEVGKARQIDLWTRGAFPRSLLAVDDGASARWRDDFITTFLERDIPQLGIRVPAETLRRFWTMVAHYHGQVWNGSELARSLGVTEKTVRNYLDILSGAFVLRVLPPWFENVGKRVVKSPKVYVRDSGLLHTLLGIDSFDALQCHPKKGASWEGFAIEQVMSMLPIERRAWFWGTYQGAEMDLMVEGGGRRLGFEFKCTDAPSVTKSLAVAVDNLRIERAYVVYPGKTTYALTERISALPLAELWSSNILV